MPSAIYEIRLLREVADVLQNLEPPRFFELAQDIDSLAYAPGREDAVELGEGFRLLKSGDSAILYSVDDDRRVVVLVRVGRQKEILEESGG